MKHKYWSNPFMDGDGKMIFSICKYVPSIMALTHLKTEKYHRISEAYQGGNKWKNRDRM